MKKIKVLLSNTGYNFYWAERKFCYKDEKPMTCYWEDISYIVIIDDKIYKGNTTVDCKKYIEYEIEEAEGEMGAKIEIKCPGYIEEKLNDTPFNMPLKELIKLDKIYIGYCYDEIDNEEKYESKLFNLPINDFGMKPCYIIGYTPSDTVGIKEVEEFMKVFIEKHFNINEKIEFEFEWVDLPTEEDIKKEWDNYLEEIEEWAKMKARGEKFSVRYSTDFMKQLFSEELINKYIDNGMIYGEPMGETDEVLLTFKDNHTEILKDSEDF
jgi:hypothetical protein